MMVGLNENKNFQFICTYCGKEIQGSLKSKDLNTVWLMGNMAQFIPLERHSTVMNRADGCISMKYIFPKTLSSLGIYAAFVSQSPLYKLGKHMSRNLTEDFNPSNSEKFQNNSILNSVINDVGRRMWKYKYKMKMIQKNMFRYNT